MRQVRSHAATCTAGRDFQKSTMPRKTIFETQELNPCVEGQQNLKVAGGLSLELSTKRSRGSPLMHDRDGYEANPKLQITRVFTTHPFNFYSHCATSATRLLRCFRMCVLQSLLSTMELANSS